MPVLTFKGKTAVESYHRVVPHHLLEIDPKLSLSKKPGLDGNLVIEGDNLVALKSLLPTHAGRIKCVYIDPPYNTGNEGWIYNDNLTQPVFKEWLGKIVGKEGEDACRHDKWCCMMYPRLQLLKELMHEDAVIFVSIDDNELHHLRMLMDEVFGEDNSVGSLVWRNVTDNNPTNISGEHEYVLCYAKQKSNLPSVWSAPTLAAKEKLIAIAAEFKAKFPEIDARQVEYTKWFQQNKAYLWPFDRYRYIDDDGIYTGSQSVHNPGKEGYRYDVLHPKTGKPCQQPLMGYRFPPETMDALLAGDRILFGDDESKIIEIKVYVGEFKTKLSSVIELDTRLGANELRAIFPEHKRPFPFAKPSAFLKEFLGFATSGDDIVLDSFAGSGTTGHAVLALNKEDGGSRRFILVQQQRDGIDDDFGGGNICERITVERVRRVSRGYGNGNQKVAGLGGEFTYARVGRRMFDEYRDLGDKPPSFEQMARYIWFTETSRTFDAAKVDEATGHIGTWQATSYYLLYSGGNSNARPLDTTFLRSLKDKSARKVIYCEKLWMHRDALREFGDVRAMLIPFNLK